MDYLKYRQLYHSGIQGMKWGIRRYQNYDGSLTPEGKARYNKGAEDNSDGNKPSLGSDGKYYYTNKKGEKVLYKTRIEDLSDNDLVDLNRRIKQENEYNKEFSNAYDYHGPKEDQALRDASRLAKDLADAIPKGNGKTIKKDYSGLTDQELSNRIRRLQLEDSYGKLSGDTIYVKSGSEKMREFLQTAGTALAVASSAAALAYTIKNLRKKDEMSQSDLIDAYQYMPEAEDSLQHHGVKGQKWGFRRYQNEDGSLTAEGRARYGGKTHVSELTDRELADLEYEQERENKKKLAIGIGVTVTATAAILGAAYLAKKHQDMANAKVSDVKTADASKSIGFDGSKAKAVSDFVKSESVANTSIADLKIAAGKKSFVSSGKKSLFNFDAQRSFNVSPKSLANPENRHSKYAYYKDPTNGSTYKILKSNLSRPQDYAKLFMSHMDILQGIMFNGVTDYLTIHTLYHHGVKGQKWGVRRYQDEDGSLTPEGKRRYRTDVGTKDILDNSSKYYDLTKDQRKEYTQYGRISGAKRGFLIGAGAGALLGAGKVGLTYALAKPGERKESGRSIVNSFTRNAMLGALGGSVVGTLIGSVAGKKTAQAELAEKGRIYVDQLLATPSKRLKL